jgi:hypothetical protein
LCRHRCQMTFKSGSIEPPSHPLRAHAGIARAGANRAARDAARTRHPACLDLLPCLRENRTTRQIQAASQYPCAIASGPQELLPFLYRQILCLLAWEAAGPENLNSARRAIGRKRVIGTCMTLLFFISLLRLGLRRLAIIAAIIFDLDKNKCARKIIIRSEFLGRQPLRPPYVCAPPAANALATKQTLEKICSSLQSEGSPHVGVRTSQS